ncbi:hypothetical protein MPSI1_002024 [Malassezia psittaci]|uniref:Uncharacterized protein n=1 Tax=Malassezia psittaci TaxID=1821823 RepID=A0AAF0JE60_9BASI|nr:hypothetical protein MPSI1_002024 [Malassezia psittaci]
MPSVMIRNVAQVARVSRMTKLPSARAYSTSPTPNSTNGMMERAQQIGSSIAKTAERMLGRYSEPIMYNLRVAGSLMKQVYIAEKLAPPTNLGTWTAAYRQMFANATNPSWWTHTLPAGEWRRVALYGTEAVGLFAIGEIIGKRSLIGYKLTTQGKDHSSH